MSNKSQETIEQELAAYKKLGSLDQRDLVATSDLSITLSAIRDDLSSKLDIVGKDCYVESIGNGTVAQGSQTSAFGEYSLALGQQSLVSGNYSHAEGDQAYVYANKAFGWSGDGKYEVSGSTRDGTFNIKPQNGINGFYINDKPLSWYLNNLEDSLSAEISCKLDKGDGGEISGNVKFLCCNLSVDHGKFVLQNDSKFIANGTDLELYDSNYKQVSIRFSSTGDELEQRVYNLSPHNSFIQSEEAYPGSNIDGSYGVACTGYRGFCVLKTDTQLKTIKLSGSPSDLAFPDSTKTISDEIAFTMQPGFDLSGGWSFTYGGSGNNHNINVLSIISGDISSFTISVDVTPTDVSSETEAIKQWDGGDENGFYYIPDITKYTNFEAEKVISGFFENRRDKDIVTLFGNQNIACFNGAHAEGGSSKAIGKYSHAEGRGSIAEGRYSHAEGSFNYAADIYSHVEGNYTYAGASTAHAEGSKTKANGTNSHAEGSNTKADGVNSHAEGNSSQANGTNSHAEGTSTTASGIAAHSEGGATTASGNYSHAEGNSTVAGKDYAHVEGYQTEARGKCSHAAGYNVRIDDDYAFAWNGISSIPAKSKYRANGIGTFNINPANGISGFYIGDKSLASYIDGISSSIIGDYATKKEVNAIGTTLNMVSSDYVKATDFAALSNDTGLSAASASNPVVTKNDIADLAGAMHFRGAVSVPSEITDPAAGDIVIIKTNSKEYVYNGNDWIELGDEAIYATKAEVSAYALKTEAADMSAFAYDEATTYTDTAIANLNDVYYNKTETSSAIEIANAGFTTVNEAIDAILCCGTSSWSCPLGELEYFESMNVYGGHLNPDDPLRKVFFTLAFSDADSQWRLSANGFLDFHAIGYVPENPNEVAGYNDKRAKFHLGSIDDSDAPAMLVGVEDIILSRTNIHNIAMLDDIPVVSSYSNTYINAISSDESGNVGLDVAEKLDKFTIYKFDSLSAYNLSGSSFGILSSDIVLIDEENINAEGHRILSVASPELSDDAATKGYVDNASANLKAKIAGSTAINALISQVDPSDGISNVEIETAISALLDLVNILSGNA